MDEKVAQHAPGPWVIDEWYADGGFYKIRSAEPGHDVICHTHSFADSDKPTSEAAANARLIAAAPEMKEALSLALMFYAPPPWTDEQRAEWARITGSDEATPKSMCDHFRKVFRKATVGLLAALALLGATTASAEIACRQNYDGSWESYDTTTGATIAHGGASGCPGRAAPPPPPPPPTSSVPALPTVGWYGRDLWANATGPRGDLTPYECGGIGSGGCKWRSRTICNEGSSRLTVIIPVDGGIGVAQPTSQLNATITVCRGGECHRVGHENIAWPASDWSQHNAVMTAWAWPGDCYVAEFYVGLPERWWEVAE